MKQKETSIKSFYSLAKYPTHELLMDAQIASSGAHQARLIEKFKKNKNYIKSQFIALKIVYGFVFLVMPIIPLASYMGVIENLKSGLYPIETILFISSFVFGFFSALMILYVLLFGMMPAGSFMSGNAFKWLQTLPFSKKNLKKLGFMTIFRSLDIPLIVMGLGLPIILLIFTQDVLIFLLTLPSSLLNVVFSFSILVIIGEKISHVFSESQSKSKKANLIRILTVAGFFIIAFGMTFVINWGFSAIENFYRIFATNAPPLFLNLILSLIPFPFAPGYLISFGIITDQSPLLLIFTSIIGYLMFISITIILLKKAMKNLNSAISSEIKIEYKEKEIREDIRVEIKPTTTIKSYIRKDLITSTRDMQSFIFLFMPIFYPLILMFSMFGVISDEITSIEAIMIMWSFIMLLYLFIPPLVIGGFLNLEESGSSTVASLPMVPREQAKAKIILMSSIQAISLTLIALILTFMLNSFLLLWLLVISLPIAWTILLFMFEMKIRLFGKMKYKYIVEELHKELKVEKWIIMIASEIVIYFVILITGSILFLIYGILTTILVLAVIGVIGLLIVIFVFTRMFPKPEKIAEYKTGGFLREHIYVGALVLMILFFIFLYLPNIIEGPFIPLLIKLPLVVILFIDFFIIMGLLILLWIVIVPFGLKLPTFKGSFNNYSQSIGLSRIKPLWNNLLIGISAFFIFILSKVLFGLILGRVYLYPVALISPPGSNFPGLLGFGWFILFFALRPGIWEEVAFRGVILNMQLKKYGRISSIIINGILFGLFHFVNLIFGQELIPTLFQVFFASCIGIAFAYMYIKTKSLLSCILVHYLIDSVSQIFVINIFNPIYITLFSTIGTGIVPMILIILFTNLLSYKKQEF